MNNVNVILTILQNMTGNNRVGTYNTISIIYNLITISILFFITPLLNLLALIPRFPSLCFTENNIFR